MSTEQEDRLMSETEAGQNLVAIVMGSRNDYPVLEPADALLSKFGVPHTVSIVSAHRTPDRMREFARGARERGTKVIIAGAGGAAHLPGMISSWTTIPVLGVPVRTSALSGVDSLLSIVQMPAGIPVGTLSIGEAGARNAALMAIEILALSDAALHGKLVAWRQQLSEDALAVPLASEAYRP